MKGGTLFSGIGAPECAAPEIDWRWCAEIEPFPSAVHAARFPGVPNLGDVTKVNWDEIGEREPIDILVFGSPCQSFSVAGKRAGLDDPRGNLTLVGLGIVGKLKPRWIIWENVPGVMSDDDGRTFGAVLGLMGQLGYGFAYRILDAQHFGVPQRRRRVFVVGHLGDWRPPAAVLFERESLSGHPAPRREAGQDVAGALTASTEGGDENDARDGRLIAIKGAAIGREPENGPQRGEFLDDGSCFTLNCTEMHAIAHTLNAKGGSGRIDGESETFVTHTLRAEGFDASEDGTGRGTPLVVTPILEAGARQGSKADTRDGLGIGGPGDPMFSLQSSKQHAVAFQSKASAHQSMNPGLIAPSIDVGKSDGIAVAFAENQRAEIREMSVVSALNVGGGKPGSGYAAINSQAMVRRITPMEAERLQGFPDGWTAITYRGKPAADGPRYRALGNSMAVPVMRWILSRIVAFDALVNQRRAAA